MGSKNKAARFTHLRNVKMEESEPEDELSIDVDRGPVMPKERQRQLSGSGEYAASKLSEKDDEFEEWSSPVAKPGKIEALKKLAGKKNRTPPARHSL